MGVAEVFATVLIVLGVIGAVGVIGFVLLNILAAFNSDI